MAKSKWQQASQGLKDSYMDNALKAVKASSKNYEELAEKAHLKMRDDGLFGSTDDAIYSVFIYRNPNFLSLAQAFWNGSGRTGFIMALTNQSNSNTPAPEKTEKSQQNSTSEKVEIAGQQVSKTTIAIVIGLVIIIVVTLFFVLKK